jgi:DNA-binding transcriptional LysR family regulator
MDRLSAMALLVKVTELGSMSAAARALNMPLTTVSRHIGELESALGVRLLARTTRKLTLTDAGVDYVAAARGSSRGGKRRTPGDGRISGAERRAGDLRADDVWTPARSSGDREFIARYPQIRVRLLLSDRNADLVGDHIDLAVRIGDLADSSMVATRLGRCALWPAPIRRCWRNTASRSGRAIWRRCRSSVLNRRCPIAAGAFAPLSARTS